ncbi:hypothetical protein H4P1_00022 (plasmid) [Variovorax sp. PBS-H4]|uniref:hypothetical protein n=1 Tax=Variovorax sp. PBS-H4 TaxID=434008 RepID=UPI001318BB11|nr:hypothetical protein [Variovorax sp. PBS-H4]VTU41390.1 hypothetical protein H4P1_00022 [Variovorax sp. PBS-H4]
MNNRKALRTPAATVELHPWAQDDIDSAVIAAAMRRRAKLSQSQARHNFTLADEVLEPPAEYQLNPRNVNAPLAAAICIAIGCILFGLFFLANLGTPS